MAQKSHTVQAKSLATIFNHERGQHVWCFAAVTGEPAIHHDESVDI